MIRTSCHFRRSCGWLTRTFVVFLLASIAPWSLASSSDCNQNGKDDALDLVDGKSHDCNNNGIPDECDLTTPHPAFELTGRLTAGYGASALSVADLDGDGDADAAVALIDSTFPGWLPIENRDGKLVARERETDHSKIDEMASGDADGDGDIDLFCLTRDGLKVLFNKGRWLFLPDTIAAVEPRTRTLAIADLDENGRLDVAMLNPFELKTLLKTSGNSYVNHQLLSLDSDPRSLLFADLDGDGHVDAATANFFDSVSIARNDGKGVFARARSYLAGSRRSALAAADLDGDSDRDLVTAGTIPGATLLRNRGEGVFELPEKALTRSGGLFVALSDLDGDGNPDVVVGTAEPDLIVGRLRSKQPNESTELSIPFGGTMAGLVAMPLSPRGPTEILALEGGSGTLSSYKFASELVSVDVNHDGIPDECEQNLFVRGDSNVNGQLELLDAVLVASFLFLGHQRLPCVEAGDFDNDGSINVHDVILVILFLYVGGLPPAPPSFACGLDTDGPGTRGNLGCAESSLWCD